MARTPKLRLHKASGQAFVELHGHRFYLGVHGKPETEQRYHTRLAEWIANGRKPRVTPAELTVVELIADYVEHAERYYRRPDGTPTSELHCIQMALKPVKRLYGDTKVSDFTPLALKTVVQEMIAACWCRTNINKMSGRIRAMFKWAAADGLAPASVYHGLLAVGGLKRGRCDARESLPVKPVDEQVVEATLRFASPQVAALIRLQLLTGCRPGEACAMRGVDIDMSGALWIYRPSAHKTQHHGHERTITLGPKAQEVIRPFLKPDVSAYLFQPRDAAAWHREQRHAKRKTPAGWGNTVGSKRKENPKRQAGAKYATTAYARAIARAAELADQWAKGGRVIGNDERLIPHWHAHQLRHSAATRLRKEYGLEATGCILGHATLSVTEIYAEKNIEAAKRIMAEVG